MSCLSKEEGDARHSTVSDARWGSRRARRRRVPSRSPHRHPAPCPLASAGGSPWRWAHRCRQLCGWQRRCQRPEARRAPAMAARPGRARLLRAATRESATIGIKSGSSGGAPASRSSSRPFQTSSSAFQRYLRANSSRSSASSSLRIVSRISAGVFPSGAWPYGRPSPASDEAGKRSMMDRIVSWTPWNPVSTFETLQGGAQARGQSRQRPIEGSGRRTSRGPVPGCATELQSRGAPSRGRPRGTSAAGSCERRTAKPVSLTGSVRARHDHRLDALVRCVLLVKGLEREAALPWQEKRVVNQWC